MKDWLEPGLPSAIASAAMAGAGVLIACWRRSAIRETTLILPWFWVVGSFSVLAACEITVGATSSQNPPAWVEAFRYLAATTTLLPLVSALGAKRPQHQVWQLIVLSLWGVFAIPAAQSLVLQTGAPLAVHGALSWFMLLLILVGLANGLPTRHWVSCAFLAAAQLLLLSPYLPLPGRIVGTAGIMFGLGFALLAVLAAAAIAPRRGELTPLDRLWLDFRDTFGLFWSLRVAERINAVAKLNKWRVTLGWNGFYRSGGNESAEIVSPEIEPALRRTVTSLMRRFVSRKWIAARLRHEAT